MNKKKKIKKFDKVEIQYKDGKTVNIDYPTNEAIEEYKKAIEPLLDFFGQNLPIKKEEKR